MPNIQTTTGGLAEGLLPPTRVKPLAESAVVSHLSPTITTPLAAGHVDDKITVLLIVKDSLIIGGIGAGPGRKRVDHSLGDKGGSSTDPWLTGVEIFLGNQLDF